MSVAVVGGGIAGLSASLLLARAGAEVTVFESGERLGGMLAPVPYDGLDLDRGSHRVHPAAHPLLLELTEEARWMRRPRRGLLILRGRMLHYPLAPLRFVQGLGPTTTLKMGLGWLRRPSALGRTFSWERDRQQAATDIGFEAFVTQRVGRAAYTMFYEPYARKVWGMDPAELSQSVAKQRVSASSPLSSILRRSASEYLYPEDGMASLISLLEHKAVQEGVTIHRSRWYSFAAQSKGAVFYTGHLSDLVDDAVLGHRGLYLLHLSVPEDCLSDTDTWYAPESKYWFGRVSQPAQFSEALRVPGRRALCVEVPEGAWGTDMQFAEHTDTLMEQLFEAGILRRAVEPLSLHQTFLPRVYPVYRRGWPDEQRRCLQAVASLGAIFPCGRQGLFLHCNMDQSIQTAAAAVEHWQSGGTSIDWIEKAMAFSDFRVRD